jgi:hypothetical protein
MRERSSALAFGLSIQLNWSNGRFAARTIYLKWPAGATIWRNIAVFTL